ncbi:MAG: ABC transporter ATP-binding protein [bacterium]|nr:ABC transporter ATP-binding protein [bacterium]
MTDKKNKAVLKAVNIHKSYLLGKRKLEVLKGVDLELKKGEISSILGISGSGKSTLLSILGTLDRPDKGHLIIDGEKIIDSEDQKLAALRNVKIGFIFQFHYLLPEFTAIENAAMPGLIKREPKKEVFEKADHYLRKVGLGERLDHKPAELSGGELQRVAVARALINDPILVLADEPTGNLDKGNGEAIYELMLSLSRETGKTFLVVTHNENIASRTDRVYTLAEGKLI